jgi:hydrogenase expression/formation protein HypE
MGKLSVNELKDMLKCIRKTSKVIVPPMAGFDSGVHKIGDDKCMVVTTDPCLGVPKAWFGWFLIHYAASDVALFGAKPEYAAINLLGPPKTGAMVFRKIMQQACETADELDMTIITGHTGTYDELATVVGTCTAYGFIQENRLITPAGAKPHDSIICIKPIGLETLVNFALTHKQQAKKLFGTEQASALVKQIKMQTCVKEALLLTEMGRVSAMHDATEGGFVAALNEIADASNLGFTVDFTKLPITEDLQLLAKHFRLSRRQVMSISSTGTLIAAVSREATDRVIRAFSENHVTAEVAGVFTQDKKKILNYCGKMLNFPEWPDDPYDAIMKK